MPPQGSQRDRLRQHDQALEELSARTQRGPSRAALDLHVRHIRLAKTAALAETEYPDSGDLLPIRFISAGGDHDSLLVRSEAGTVECKILSGAYLPEGTLISVFEYCGLWWSETSAGFQMIYGLATAEVNGDNFTIDNVWAFQGLNPTTSTEETVEIKNTWGKHGDDNAKCLAVYDQTTGFWHCLELTKPACIRVLEGVPLEELPAIAVADVEQILTIDGGCIGATVPEDC